MTQKTTMNRYTRGASWMLIVYLSIMISGCTSRPEVLSPEAARIIQTNEYNGTPEEVARGVVIVLQEMHYTLGNVDMGLGIITAEKSSERSLAPLSQEPANESEIDDGVKTFFIVAGVAIVIGFILAIIFGDDDEDDDGEDRQSRRSRRHHGHHESSTVYVGSNDYEPASYLYTMTVVLEETMPSQTQVRVTVQGQHYEGPSVSESGPVQSQEFYADFFTRLQIALNQ